MVDYDLLIEQLVNGFVTGSIYALVAVGMTMTFGVLRAINFAHGEYYMLGTFGAWYVIDRLGSPYLASVVAAVAITAVIATVVGYFVMQRLIAAPFQSGVLATLGISLILQNTVILAFGGGYKFFEGGYLDPVEIGPLFLAQQRILVVVATLAVFLGLEVLVRYSRLGKAMRAVSQNVQACHVVGIEVDKVVLATFVLGTALAGLSGVLTAPINTTVYGGMGELITFKTFAIIIMGGMGNVRGTLLAGWLLGIIESFVAGFVGLQYRDAVGFVALIVMLMVRPHGLFSTSSRF